MLFDVATARKILRDEVSITLRLRRPACHASQVIPLATRDGMLGRLQVRCVWRTAAGGPWEKPWGIEDVERSVGKLGFESMRYFRAWWLEVHDPGWWARGDRTQGACFDRFQTRWQDRSCWAVSFRVARDVPRLLAPCGRPPRRSDGREGLDVPEDLGYVSSPFLALPDEPEAIDPAEADRMAAVAGQGQVARFAEAWKERRSRPLDERLRLAELDAATVRADVSGRLRVIERQVEAIERITRRTAA